jgi:Tfp pilus assembly protein PilV
MMANTHTIKGVSIIESLVCLVVIGIGFTAVAQLSAYAIGSMDRSLEKTKVNFFSEMIMEDMYADPGNVSSYGGFDEGCGSSAKGGASLAAKKRDKWRTKLNGTDHIKVGGYSRKRPCKAAVDKKNTYVRSETANRISGRLNYTANRGRQLKYLGGVIR